MKLGIVGSGKIVGDFLEIINELPTIEFNAIIGTERSLKKLETIQNDYQVKRTFTDYDLFLDEADIDTVYIALPNHLHYEYAKKALLKGFNVICEKPFTLNLTQFLELKKLALTNQLILLEAITNQYQSNYQAIKKNLSEIGELKLIECNYSQYSSRYDAFKEGTILPAFNPKMGGGALMDINIYNIHFVVGLLGKPKKVTYLPNIEREIDTSGILILDYPQTKVVCIGAKDSTSDIRSTLQGTKGAIVVNGATNVVGEVVMQLNDQQSNTMNVNQHSHRMYEEFQAFSQIVETKNLEAVREKLEHSQLVMEVVEEALKSAQLKLG